MLSAVKRSAQKAKAQTGNAALATAIQAYDSAYGRFPVSAAAQTQASQNAQNNLNPDFTYGGTFQTPNGSPPATTIGTVVNGSVMSNAEVIAILMDITNTAVTTVNQNHQKNPQQHVFLSAKTSGDTSSPGVGTDLVYRDPWGNPYVITMDLNYNDFCVDTFYGMDAISSTGLYGLIQDTSVPVPNNWAYRGKVMVWSAGPDGIIDPPAQTSSANKDNVLTWK